MNAGPQHGLHRSFGEYQGLVPRNPVLSYPFGQSAESKSSTGRDGTSDAPDARERVSVEDPRVIHGRIGEYPSAEADEQRNEHDALPVQTASPRRSRGRGRRDGPNEEGSPVSGAERDAGMAVEPISQSQAIVQVRKHILSDDSGTDQASSGRLVTERFDVGWIVYPREAGQRRTSRIYYVTDDGELETTSSTTERSVYVESVEQRFWQRRALFG